MNNKAILYIVGAQNSGSTLLDAAIGNSKGVFGLGEVGRIFNYTDYSACGCGQIPMACSVCSEIKNKVFSGLSAKKNTLDLSKILKERNLLSFLFSGKLSRRYAKVSDEIYKTVFEVSDERPTLLVDSSKNVSRAISLSRHSAYPVFFLHVVRDGRGYINSRNNPSRKAITGESGGFFVNLWKWLIKNLMVSLCLKPFANNYKVVRYEDFINNPDAVVKEISLFVNTDIESNFYKGSDIVIKRNQIFESPRRVDYSSVKIDEKRLFSQQFKRSQNWFYWLLGGFIGSIWGYKFRQDYLIKQ